MPVHRDRDKKESAAVDMEVEEQEHEASSSEEDDSDMTSVTEDGESSGEKFYPSFYLDVLIVRLHLFCNHFIAASVAYFLPLLPKVEVRVCVFVMCPRNG